MPAVTNTLTIPDLPDKEIAECAPVIIWITDPTGNCLYLNNKWHAFTGQSPESGMGLGWLNAVHPQDRPAAKQAFIKANESKDLFHHEYRLRATSGKYRWVLDNAAPRFNEAGEYLGYVGCVIEIHALKIADEKLKHSNNRFKAAIEAVEGIMWTNSRQGLMKGKQLGWQRLTGQKYHEYLNFGWAKAVHPEDINATIEAWKKAVSAKVNFEFEHRVKTAAGEWRLFSIRAVPVLDEAGNIFEWVGVHTDITQKRAYESQIEHLATHDALTSLPNRLLLTDRILQLITQRGDHKHGILFMDIDRFKTINDSLGHQLGDDLLSEIAKRLSLVLRKGDTVSRIGGDEFVVLLANVASEDVLTSVADQILTNVSSPITLSNHVLNVTLSIGGSLYPRDGNDVETLLKHADLAMYQSKKSGRNKFRFFDAEMNAKMLKRLLMEIELKRALERDEFVLHYQPIVNVETSIATGVEALIRWQNPERGLLMPNDFVFLAEELGLIKSIDMWVIKAACQQVKAWQGMGMPNLSLSVNISSCQMSSSTFDSELQAILSESAFPAHSLELEITETTLMENLELAEQMLLKIQHLGVSVAIDDFGTGYSSLSYLKKLPINTLKIDQSFIKDMPEDMDDAAIVGATISLAKSLNLHIIAEGVARLEQLNSVLDKGCITMQGYYFSKPQNAQATYYYLQSRLLCF